MLLLAAIIFIDQHIVQAQGITLPQSSPEATIEQEIGIATVKIVYSRPNVVNQQGVDRTDKIWGALVPYGFNNLGFGSAEASPWRAGANENTTIELSHDASIEGKPLSAGKYGLHMAVEESGEVTVIFSQDHTSWGSYFYDEGKDALRVQVKSEEHASTPMLTYGFVDVDDKVGTVVLDWEKKRIPFKVEFNTPELVYRNLKAELQSNQGFSLNNWTAATNYLIQHNIHLDEALTWANTAVEGQFFSEKNFRTLQTKSNVLAAMGKADEADKVMAEALSLPTASITDYYTYGRQLIGLDKDKQALEVFKQANKKWKDHWLAPHGLARGYSALGEYAKALKMEKEALSRAPEGSKGILQTYVQSLEQNQDFN